MAQESEFVAIALAAAKRVLAPPLSVKRNPPFTGLLLRRPPRCGYPILLWLI
jgi:hypothetical protein